MDVCKLVYTVGMRARSELHTQRTSHGAPFRFVEESLEKMHRSLRCWLLTVYIHQSYGNNAKTMRCEPGIPANWTPLNFRYSSLHANMRLLRRCCVFHVAGVRVYQ